MLLTPKYLLDIKQVEGTRKKR